METHNPEQESEQMHKYFSKLKEDLDYCYEYAQKARAKGFDPATTVEIPLARDMAERVEGLISIAAPQLVGSGVIARIKELEAKYGRLGWEVALLIAEEVAKEKFCKFKDKKEAMEIGIRTGFAYNTLGIVSAPLEGFIELRIKKRNDGKEYVAATYAGPIRGAGGTAAAFSVIITDYVRTKMGYARYDPTENEIKRYITEIQDYHERVTNLQYFPSEEEITFMCKNLPIEVDGEPTEEIEVSNYKDLPRIETNKIRGGICLVIGEGLTQKSKKLWKRLEKFGKEFGIEWEFLAKFLDIQKQVRSKMKPSGEEKKEKIVPDHNFIKDLVAGRPVLSYPLRPGGFRLRYGRTRTTGFSAAAVHPNTLALLFDYIATGTQLRLERPGKACSVTPIDSIDPPIVLLKSGDVLRVSTEEDIRLAKRELDKILYLGDLLISFGDFSENGHILVPSGYCQEWWYLELRKAVEIAHGVWNINELSEKYGLSRNILVELEKQPIVAKVPLLASIHLSQQLRIPLHPDFTYFWKLLKKEQMLSLLNAFKEARIEVSESRVTKIIFNFDPELKSALEILGINHKLQAKEFIILEGDHAHALYMTLNLENAKLEDIERYCQVVSQCTTTMLDALNEFSPFPLRDKAGTFVGARMGRPEKAKMRKLKGSPHALFPIGDEGGRMRSFQSALQEGKVTADFPCYICPKCAIESVYNVCHKCGTLGSRRYFDSSREDMMVEKKSGDHIRAYRKTSINIREYFSSATNISGYSPMPTDVVKGVKGTSNEEHIPEHIVKGLLRAKHGIYVNKDGTTRYDMSELPITHFKPEEIGTSVEKLVELGYTHDIYGEPLSEPSQILELRPQDLILPGFKNLEDEPCDEVLFRIANFIDDLLVKLYGLEPFYKLKDRKDIIGHLVVGLAPHISAGMVGRVIGFSLTQGMYAHPLYHASLRRDCDGDEACVMLLFDALINFSRQFLPNRRGAKTMDSPLVLTSKLLPAEVDDQVHGLDIMFSYPLEFYETALEYQPTSSVKITQMRHNLDTPKQYEGFGFTHPLSNINIGVLCSAYKTLESMDEKLDGQMRIARIIQAVDAAGVAAMVIEKHFLKDIKGNLRKFSTQEFTCNKCNENVRRPPLSGRCPKCGNSTLQFTVSEGSVIKYLEASLTLANDYAVTPYLKQVMELTKRRIEDVFGKDKEMQTGLGQWA